VIGAFRETGSGAKLDRAERNKVMALAQRREIDARVSLAKAERPAVPYLVLLTVLFCPFYVVTPNR
jgi:hypothetical protein